MSRKKNILMASACIVLGMALAGPAAHAAEEVLTAVRSSHQVYLDGDWYCVDVTWDDPTGAARNGRHHRYFNVTSAYLRETDHQWDYRNVPEATAAAYAWKAD